MIDSHRRLKVRANGDGKCHLLCRTLLKGAHWRCDGNAPLLLAVKVKVLFPASRKRPSSGTKRTLMYGRTLLLQVCSVGKLVLFPFSSTTALSLDRCETDLQFAGAGVQNAGARGTDRPSTVMMMVVQVIVPLCSVIIST